MPPSFVLGKTDKSLGVQVMSAQALLQRSRITGYSTEKNSTCTAIHAFFPDTVRRDLTTRKILDPNA